MKVSISTMPAGQNYLSYVKQIEQFADFLHLDVCDGKYNSTTCFLPEFASDINQHSTIFLDCHLMTLEPLVNAKKYLEFGANLITAQFESFKSQSEVQQFVDFLHSNNALCGLSLEPETDVLPIEEYLSKIDLVLVMAVKTGASGQKFDDSILKKISQLAQYRSTHNLSFKIEVDGGINEQTAKQVKSCGADIVVSGSYVFCASDKQRAIELLK